jgi:D-sedoheptulose 7-phosphate isomerase
MNFKTHIENAVADSIGTKQRLQDLESENILKCGMILAEAIKNGNKLLFCGNGGSAADSQHLAAELVVRLRSHINRPALAAIALTVDTSILTAGGNDIGFDNIFARGVEAYGQAGDVLIGISTSGNSENVIRAIEQAKSRNLKVVALLGGSGGKMDSIVDNKVVVPSNVTARIQESHILIGHIWCEMIEEYCFPELFE